MKNELYRSIVSLSKPALISNFRTILHKAPGQKVIAMVKANAYGHGALWVTEAIQHEEGLYGFGVTSVQEGIEIREGLPSCQLPIIVFCDSTSWTVEKKESYKKYNLTPVIYSIETWKEFFKSKDFESISYEIHWNTGLNHLGLPCEFLPEFLEDLKSVPSQFLPRGVMIRLACPENPLDEITHRQLEKFEEIQSALMKNFSIPLSAFHFANSAAIWNSEAYHLEKYTGRVRPGLALYGVHPLPMKGLTQQEHMDQELIHSLVEEGSRELIPVMSFKAQVISIRTLHEGDVCGFGAAYQTDCEEQVAILSAGYADGVTRALGQCKGEVFLNGEKTEFLGGIGMDLCSVRANPDTRVGDWAEFWGNKIDPWIQAAKIGTIPYELFTSISSRVPRIDSGKKE